MGILGKEAEDMNWYVDRTGRPHNQAALDQIHHTWVCQNTRVEPDKPWPRRERDPAKCSGCGAPRGKDSRDCAYCATPVPWKPPSGVVTVGDKGSDPFHDALLCLLKIVGAFVGLYVLGRSIGG